MFSNDISDALDLPKSSLPTSIGATSTSA